MVKLALGDIIDHLWAKPVSSSIYDAKKVLQALYDEYKRTGNVDYCNATTLSKLPSNMVNFCVNQLEAIGFIRKNILGEVKLTKLGISYFNE